MRDLSLERIFKALLSLGLSQIEAKIYIYLSTKNPMKAKDIICNLKINKQQLYRNLKSLRNKKIVTSSQEFPATFNTVPLEKALKILIKTKFEQAQDIKEKKATLLSHWSSITKENSVS